MSAASRVDYAAAIVAVLSGGDHQNKIYELAGDACFTLSDLAAEVSGQSGKEIVYRNLSESEYTEALKGLGVPEGFAATIAGWDVSTSKNDLYYTEHVLSDLIGRPTTAWTDSVKQALA